MPVICYFKFRTSLRKTTILETNPIPAPNPQTQQTAACIASCFDVLWKMIPLNSGSPQNSSYIPQRRPATVNIARNKAEPAQPRNTQKIEQFPDQFHFNRLFVSTMRRTEGERVSILQVDQTGRIGKRVDRSHSLVSILQVDQTGRSRRDKNYFSGNFSARRRQMFRNASRKIAPLILEVPALRSGKRMGNSTIRQPCR